MHWSLAELREMDLDEYGELLEWAGERNQPKDSTDADALIAANDAVALKAALKSKLDGTDE